MSRLHSKLWKNLLAGAFLEIVGNGSATEATDSVYQT
jgi:hypothetical protein